MSGESFARSGLRAAGKSAHIGAMNAESKPLTVLWFAWLRERTGVAEERLAVPPEVATVADLIAWLTAHSPGHRAALENRHAVRCAVNQDFAGLATPLRAGDEVAFFPPVTGG
jgi:molybdopterin converting factor subunit 1